MRRIAARCRRRGRPPSVWNGVIDARARGLLGLLWSRGVTPRTLKVLVALGDLDAVRDCFDESSAPCPRCRQWRPTTAVNDAFLCACRFSTRRSPRRCWSVVSGSTRTSAGGSTADRVALPSLGICTPRRHPGTLGKPSSWARCWVRSPTTICRSSRACRRACPGCSAMVASTDKLTCSNCRVQQSRSVHCPAGRPQSRRLALPHAAAAGPGLCA